MSRGVKISIAVVLLAGLAYWYFYTNKKLVERRNQRLSEVFSDPGLIFYMQKSIPPPLGDPGFKDWAFEWTAVVNEALPGINVDDIDAALVSSFINSPNGMALRNNFYRPDCGRVVGRGNVIEWRTESGELCGQPVKMDFVIDARIVFGKLG